jgi:hypothetical protein
MWIREIEKTSSAVTIVFQFVLWQSSKRGAISRDNATRD